MRLRCSGLAKISLIFLSFLTTSSCLLWAKPERAFDYYIQNAVVFDGQSAVAQKTDVGIQGDRITFIGKIGEPRTEHLISGKGFVLAPGFMDVHTHSDFNPWVYPDLTNKIEQGVTTEITGNCGMSAAPVLGAMTTQMHAVWAREGVQIPATLGWSSFAEYRERLKYLGLKGNLIGLVGHGNLRYSIVGTAPRPASDAEIESMKRLLRTSMKEGALGISFGLSYLPGIYAEEKEVTELCREAGRSLGICAFHIRSEGAELIESIQEVIRIAEKTGSPVQISHLKAGGKANWSKIDEAIRLIDAARLKGLKVAADAYPYEAGYAELAGMLPDALYSSPTRNADFKNILKRQAILDQLRAYDDQGRMRWDSVVLASSHIESYQEYEGMTLRSIARKLKMEPEKFLMSILADADFEVSAFYFSQTEEVIQKVMREPWVFIGSDSVADGTRKPHPRCVGTFPKTIREFTREKKKVPLGEMIRRMTFLPAEHFGIQNRGRIEVGAYADLVLFDAGEIRDEATYKEPTRKPRGIRWVFVNGVPVIEDGKCNSFTMGRTLVGGFSNDR